MDRREAVSPADFLDMRRQEGVFEHFAAFEWWTANLVGTDEPENVQGFYVTSDFFSVMGVEPAAGRMFLPEDETIGQHRRVVLGHGLWQRRFASDPAHRRPRHRDRWPAVRRRGYRAAGVRLSHGLAALGADDVRCGKERQSPLPLHHGHRAPGTRTHARRRQSADGGRGRTAHSRPPRHQSRPRVACLHAGAGHAGHRDRTDSLDVAGIGRARTPHRVRQRCEPAPGAGRRAPP